MNPTSQKLVDDLPLQALLGIPAEALDQVMATAYVLYRLGRYAEVEILCKGLIAADHSYWWSYSLYAAALREQGRFPESLDQLDLGLKYEPNQPKLLDMRRELLDRIESPPASCPASTQQTSSPPLPATPGRSTRTAVSTPNPAPHC